VALFTFQPTSSPPNDLKEYFKNFKALLLASKEAKKPISIIVDLKNANWINISYVKSKIDFIKELQSEDLVKDNLKSSAVIFESAFTTWVLDMILKFVKTQSPVSSFLNIQDAIDWSLKN
jgi:hypothetical protein